MGRIVTGIDTGRASAWGWHQNGELIACGLMILRDDRPVGLPPMIGALAFVEYPQDYPGHQRKVDPNDLIKLGSRAGRVQEHLLIQGNEVRLVKPHVWKGGVPKNIHHERIRASLTAKELAVVHAYTAPVAEGLKHNIWDAIGLTLWGARQIGERS
jgi:hypothetical protein